MPHALRDYQTKLVDQTLTALQTNNGVVVQLATGAGKTVVAAELASILSKRGANVAFVAHRRELLQQARNKLGDFATVASIVEASRLPTAPDVLFFDECHRSAADSWQKLGELFPAAKVVGLSATPGRLDRKPLAPMFGEIVSGPPLRDLIRAGWLSDYRYFAPARPDLGAVKLREGEYDRAGAEAVMRSAIIVGDVVDHYRRLASGRPALLFAISVRASREMAERFNAAGIPAAHVDGETPDDERDAAFAAMRSGALKILCNVEIATEGVDLPDLGAVILLRPTKSLTLARQMIGRALRPSADPRPVVILDHANLYYDHQAPDVEHVWTLDGAEPRRKYEIEGGVRPRSRRCPTCAYVHAWGPVCLDCGHVYEDGPREATEIGGELAEIGAIELPWVTQVEYERMRGLRKSTVKYWVKNGLPRNSKGLIQVAAADEWRQKCGYVPRPGFMTHREFAKRCGISAPLISKWARKGMPVDEFGFVRVVEADEWVSQRVASRDRLIAESRAQLLRPEVRAKATAGAVKFHQSDAARAAASDRMKKTMSSPDAREKMLARASAARSTQEARAVTREQMKRRFETPEARRAQSEKLKEFWRSKRAGRRLDPTECGHD